MKTLVVVLSAIMLTACASQQAYPVTYKQERADWEHKQRDTIRNANVAIGRL